MLREICDDYGARLHRRRLRDRQTDFVAPLRDLRRGHDRQDGPRTWCARDPRRGDGKGTGLGWPDTAGISPSATGSATRARRTQATLPEPGRYLSAVYLQRPDVQHGVPRGRAGRPRAASWLGRGLRRPRARASRRSVLHRAQATGIAPALGRRSDRAHRVRARAVEVVGYFNADLGIGEAARQFVASLRAAGDPALDPTYTARSSRRARRGPTVRRRRAARYDTALVCVNADMLPTFARDAGRRSSRTATDRAVVLGARRVPDEMPGRRSTAGRDLGVQRVQRQGAAPRHRQARHVVPHPAHAPPQRRRIPEIADDVFTFLFVFDYLSVLRAQEPAGAGRGVRGPSRSPARPGSSSRRSTAPRPGTGSGCCTPSGIGPTSCSSSATSTAMSWTA